MNNPPEHLTDSERELWNNCYVADVMGSYRRGAMEGLLQSLSVSRARVAELEAIIAAHDLCHDLHGKVGPREFADGCAAEQRKIYGCAPDADENARLRAALADAIRSPAGVVPDSATEFYKAE